MDAFTAGRLSRTIDTLHSVSYFLPEAAERFGAIGMVGRTPYFAARSAPMGAVGAEVVAAILRRGAESIPNGDGRALYAAHAGLPWPESVHGQLWHAVTLLREYRGDGHIAALITHALGGLEALITHTAAGIGFSVEFARRLRGWSDEQWAAGVDRLRERGLVDDKGVLTSTGTELRSRIEDLTDKLAYQPWRTLSDDDGYEVAAVAKAIREAVQSAGTPWRGVRRSIRRAPLVGVVANLADRGHAVDAGQHCRRGENSSA